MTKLPQAGGSKSSGAVHDEPLAKQAFDNQWEDLRMIVDSVPAFIWYKDCDNRVLRVNRPAAESLGLSVEAIEGRSTYDLYPEDAAKYHADDLEVVRSGQAKLGIVETLATASGEKRWIRTDKVPYRDSNGEVVGVIVFAVDITERVRAEEALRDARDGLERRVEERTHQLATAVKDLRAEMAERQHAEERFALQQSQLAHLQRLRTVEGMATQLAHEINQPLGAIVNFAGGLLRWLSSGRLEAEAVRKAAEQINEQALRAGAVVRRLREFVRKEEVRNDRCMVVELVNDAVRFVDADAHHRGVSIRVIADRAAPLEAEINRVQIEQVVINLLTNALEAMEDSPSREVLIETIGRDDGYLEVRVSDTGKGLPVADADRLFAPFFTTKPDGLGMGLTISQSIIVAHGGTIWARSRPEGGATVAFALPCCARQHEKSG